MIRASRQPVNHPQLQIRARGAKPRQPLTVAAVIEKARLVDQLISRLLSRRAYLRQLLATAAREASNGRKAAGA